LGHERLSSVKGRAQADIGKNSFLGTGGKKKTSDGEGRDHGVVVKLNGSEKELTI